ncbi:MAG: glycosyltransferase [Ferrovibrio sp.]
MLFLSSLLHGGTERQAVVLARELARRGHAVHIVVQYEGGSFAAELASSGIEYSDLMKRGRYDLIKPYARLVRLIREWRADILYSFLPTQNIVAATIAPLLGECRLVLGVRAAGMQLDDYDWLAKLAYRIEALAARRAALVIANSKAGLEWCYGRGFPRDKLKWVPNGIDVGRFRPDPDARTAVRRKLGIAEGQRLVALIGRLDVMKDHPNFLRAASRLVDRDPEMVFVCAGNGSTEYQMRLRAISSDLGVEQRMVWLPAQDDVAKFMCAVDVSVLSSAFGEGFPNVVAESMACGVPVAATDVGDCREILKGLLPVAPPRSPEALADLILAVVQRDGVELRGALRERVVSHYDERTLGDNAEALLMQVCAAGNAGTGLSD